MKIHHLFRLLIAVMLPTLIAASCGPPPTSPAAEPPSAPSTALPPPTEIPATPTTAPTINPLPTTTQITIDGNPSDWKDYKVLTQDPAGDQKGGNFDITAVRAFTNDTFLYVLIETKQPASDFVQVDLDVRSGNRDYVISFFFGAGQAPHMGETTTGEWKDIGQVTGSLNALGEAVEIKMPLFYFNDPSNLQLSNIRPMNGQCCDVNWNAIDEISPQKIANLKETESAAGLALLPKNVCTDPISPAAPFGSLEPAPITFSEPGFSAEWFVAPGTFNMPLDIILSPAGDILVLAVRDFALFRLNEDGSAVKIADNVEGYQGDVDQEGNVYIHFMPTGKITRITKDGLVQVIAQSPLLKSDCDSGFGFGPDGNLYAAMSGCPATPYLLKITPSGEITKLSDTIPDMNAIRTSPDGRLIGAGSSGVYEISLADYSVTRLNHDPVGNISSGGMAIDDSGNIYLSSGQRNNTGLLQKMDPAGRVTKIADIPLNGISGIEWLSDTNEIIGGQLRQGGILAVKTDGTIRQIVSGNGIITPMGLAFSPCGELLVANDDGGMLTITDPAGKVSWFIDYLSFQPPLPYLAFAADGAMFASEAAPGLFPVRVAVKRPGAPDLTTLVEANYPSGLAYSADGVLFVSETSAHRILKVQPDGNSSSFVEGLHYPTALTLDPEGNLYVVVAPDNLQTPADHPPTFGDKILKIKPDGSKTIFAAGFERVVSVAFGSDGYLYATTVNHIYRVSPDGKKSLFASGFISNIGLAFDLAGNLYVSDERANGIIRIGGFPHGDLSGKVMDEQGNPAPDARVQVVAAGPIVVGQVVFTDREGNFNLPASPGKYSVNVSLPGFQTASRENIVVQTDQQSSVEIGLKK